jgi:hypothetical protein
MEKQSEIHYWIERFTKTMGQDLRQEKSKTFDEYEAEA